MKKWFGKSRRNEHSEMHSSLLAARNCWGISPSCVIDVGAAKGKWSQDCSLVWPNAKYILVEPLEESLTPLKTLLNAHPSWIHIPAAAGAEKGEILFSVTDDLDGSGVYNGKIGSAERTVPVVRLEDACKIPGPYLLKLDTHGFEIPIFEGSGRILREAELLVVEAYGHNITPDSLLFHELCNYLANHDFRPARIVDIMNRPSDGSLWQMDVFFLKASHAIFNNVSYQ